METKKKDKKLRAIIILIIVVTIVTMLGLFLYIVLDVQSIVPKGKQPFDTTLYLRKLQNR